MDEKPSWWEQKPLHCGGHTWNSQASLYLLNATLFLKTKLMPSLCNCNSKKEKKKRFFLSKFIPTKAQLHCLQSVGDTSKFYSHCHHCGLHAVMQSVSLISLVTFLDFL